MAGRGTSRFQPTLPARGATIFDRFRRSYTHQFQPTLPARGATCPAAVAPAPCANFNPRSPHGERRQTSKPRRAGWHFNPRSPHGERLYRMSGLHRATEFQPTLPARGATCDGMPLVCHVIISTHAPRTGSDHTVGSYATPEEAISTHAPRTGSDTTTGRFCKSES